MQQVVTDSISSRGQGSLNVPLLCLAAFALFGVIVYIPEWVPFLRGYLSEGIVPYVKNRDFANYWLGAQLFAQGEHRILFTQDTYFAYFQQVMGADSELRNWSYPPHFLLFLWPLHWLDYKSAMVVFLGSTFAFYLLAVRSFRREFAPEAKPIYAWLAIIAYVPMQAIHTQNGFFLAAFLLFGLACAKRRPALAGLAFACLTVKPQLGLLIPLLLLIDRNWRAIGWAALFTVVLVGLSVALLGIDSWRAYLTETLAYQTFVMTGWEGIFLKMMPTFFASVRALGYTPTLGFIVQLNASIAALALVVWLLLKQTDPLRRCFVMICGTFLVTPYAFNYDMGALCVVAALLVGSDRAPASRAGSIVLAVVAGIVAAVTNLGRAGLPITPVILAAGLLVIANEVNRSQRASVAETQPPGP